MLRAELLDDVVRVVVAVYADADGVQNGQSREQVALDYFALVAEDFEQNDLFGVGSAAGSAKRGALSLVFAVALILFDGPLMLFVRAGNFAAAIFRAPKESREDAALRAMR